MAERYKVYEQLGIGGVGAVYRAYDNELKRWVAIKRLISVTEMGGDEKLASDLRREADALASLRNPNIVTIFDVASDAEGLFMVMELLEGEDLADVVARGPLHYDDFKELASQTVEALLAAHQRHILHRDIKPENIKVERLPGGRMQSKIIDFGLARTGLRARKQTEDVSGTVMGSIFYMAPEQLTRKPTDERTDLYSLGCVFYEALSGRKAFDGDTVNVVIDKHIEHDILPLHVIAPHVPPWLGAWVLRLMALKPEDRPANAQQAIEEFRAWEKMASAPQMMPWMPPAYVPQPGNYTQPVYPGNVTTSSVPVQTVYYQTGQVPTYQTGHVPQAVYAIPAQEVIPVAQPIIEVAAQTAQLTTAQIRPASPAAARTINSNAASSRAGTQQKKNSSAVEKFPLSANQKKIGIIAGGLCLIAILAVFLFSGEKTSTNSSPSVSTASASASKAGLEKIYHQLPGDRQIPPQDDDLVLHLVAGTGQAKNGKGNDGRPISANDKESVVIWYDLASRGQGNIMQSPQNDPALAPVRQSWNHTNAKFGRVTLDFRPRNGKPSTLILNDPGEESGAFPFGSASTRNAKGLTLGIVLQADAARLPCQVCTLSGKDGSAVILRVTKEKQLQSEFRNGSGGKSTLTSKDIDATKPTSVLISWQADTGATFMRARDGADKTYSSNGSPVPAPKQPLSQLQFGRPQKAEGTVIPPTEQFSGWLAEVTLYSSILRQDQLQLLEGTNFKSYYFINVAPLAQRLKTKLPQIEPRSEWTFNPSQNSTDAKYVADGNISSRWGTKAKQVPGQKFELTLPQEQNIAGIALDCQAASMDYPRKFLIEVSTDGSNWKSIQEAEGKGALIEIVFASPQPASHLRITQKSNTPTNDWNICELVLFKK